LNAFAIILISVGGLISFANWFSVIQSYRTKRFHSAVPLFGAVFLGAGMLASPATRAYALLAIIADYGTLALLLASPRLIREAWNTSNHNLVYEYLGQAGMKTVRLRLFRRGIFTIRLELHRPPGETGLVSTGTVGSWKREGANLFLSTEREKASFEIKLKDSTEALRQLSGFESWEKQNELSLASIDFLQVKNRVALTNAK
jgi:hypothetical protein